MNTSSPYSISNRNRSFLISIRFKMSRIASIRRTTFWPRITSIFLNFISLAALLSLSETNFYWDLASYILTGFPRSSIIAFLKISAHLFFCMILWITLLNLSLGATFYGYTAVRNCSMPSWKDLFPSKGLPSAVSFFSLSWMMEFNVAVRF